MNVLKDMILTEIEGEFYAVPVGEAAKRFSGMICMNRTGKRIFELLAEGKDRDGVVCQLMQEYDVAGNVAGELHLMGNDDHGFSLLSQLLHDAQHFAYQLRIERRGRLIKQ